MSPQDKVERVLKEIHQMFSKSMEIGGMTDKMVVDRAEFMDLIDQLTKGMYELMEQYEQTRQTRLAAERSFRRAGDEIIEQANASAEDVYAASMLYTADTIGKIRALMDQVNDSMSEQFSQFRRDLREQKDLLRAHESELQAQLADLADTRKYLGVLRDINREQERINRDLEAEREMGNQYAQNLFRNAVAGTEEESNAAGTVPASGAAAATASGDKPEVTVNEDAPYFKWKAQLENELAEAEALGNLGPDERKEAEEHGEPAGPRRVTPVERPQEEPKYPREDAIYQQVLEDERKQEAEDEEEESSMGVGEVVKNLIFGRDPD